MEDDISGDIGGGEVVVDKAAMVDRLELRAGDKEVGVSAAMEGFGFKGVKGKYGFFEVLLLAEFDDGCFATAIAMDMQLDVRWQEELGRNGEK